MRVLQSLLQSSELSEETETGTRTLELDDESKASATAIVHSKLPLTISIETQGGVATPLIEAGKVLPVENAFTFSTAADNQTAVLVRLFWGGRPKSVENISLGEFTLDLPPAPKGVPQIEISTKVDKALMMTVTAKDLGTGRTEVLDAVDLSRIEIPDELASELREMPKVSQSPRDIGEIFEKFSDLKFSDLFGKGEFSQRLDLSRTAYITQSEAKTGRNFTTINGMGQSVDVKIPPNIRDGQRIRLPAQGRKRKDRTGDLFIKVLVRNSPPKERTLCKVCNGKGSVMQNAGGLRVQTVCPKCGGEGMV